MRSVVERELWNDPPENTYDVNLVFHFYALSPLPKKKHLPSAALPELWSLGYYKTQVIGLIF